ncbi:MAG TPA: L-ribulose-5-phosphate 4-epimerase AraD [Acidobacteriaceae bacterium]|jgi:L-ribulose-5-phosphate 4-epimerase|nr:L-ribulose-5-phosphate 4-epimerase AraD [Acidobacteriaceae bacterium]
MPATLHDLRAATLAANLEIVARGLVLYTFGNASGYDPALGLVAIKPSGVPYEDLRPEDLPVFTLDGTLVEGTLRPSSDLDTHLHLYRSFPGIGGVVHTHSDYATSWAQAGRPIPAFGTTHADYFHGPVPVTPPLTDDEINGDYVLNTGIAITRTFEQNGIDPLACPSVLVAGHAPFAWGKTPHDAAHNAVVLEAVARMAFRTTLINNTCDPVSQGLLDRHYFRKHGSKATYGQG